MATATKKKATAKPKAKDPAPAKVTHAEPEKDAAVYVLRRQIVMALRASRGLVGWADVARLAQAEADKG